MNSRDNSVQRVHLLGICGTAMTALAGGLKELGHEVSGSDEHVYPPMSDHLTALGIPLQQGYRAENIPDGADLVVVGNVIRERNPEAEEVRRRNLPFISMAEAVHRYLIAGRESLVVVGTHGKTTTTALAAQTLTALGADPGFLVGGIARNFNGNFRLGGGDMFVIEGDEYDTAYFDKTPKFFKYHPRTLVFTSMEFDHADIYEDLRTIRGHFQALIAGLPRDGKLIACVDDVGVRGLLGEAPCPVVTYGEAEDADCRMHGWRAEGEGGSFETTWRGGREAWWIPMPGRHNALNACAVLVTAGLRGYGAENTQRALQTFQGVKRRQEVRGVADGITVIDDFAHHPTAVRLTIEAMRERYQGSRLWAVFEPRSFTARSDRFQDDFGPALAGADRVVLAPPFQSSYSGGTASLDTAAVAEHIKQSSGWALAAEDTDAILACLVRDCRPGDVVLIMSNGGFDDLHERLLTGLNNRSQSGFAAG